MGCIFQVIIWVHQDKLYPDVADHLSPEGCQTNLTCVQIKEFQSAVEDLKDWANSDERNSSEKIVLAKTSVYLDGASYASNSFFRKVICTKVKWKFWCI